MPPVIRRGSLPSSPHTEFYAKDGAFTLEEIHGSYGFSGPHSRKIHYRYPTVQALPPKSGDFNLRPKPAPAGAVLQPYHLLTGRIPYGKDAIRARVPLVVGPSTDLSASRPNRSMPKDVFFRNGERHEAYFVQDGSGVFSTEYGDLPFRKGHYLVIPKGTTYSVALSSKTAWFLIVESRYPIDFPPHYLNSAGQAKLMAPVVETQIEAPEFRAPVRRAGRFAIDVKHDGGRITRISLGHHPFDLVGWEGALYPFAFDVKNHHGIARDIHTAPPMHQTFESGSPPNSGFSVCSFVPQMEGWHAKEIPAPYSHFNVDSDECMFFSNVNYGARKGVIEAGSLTFHPGAIPHGPQGDAALRSTSSRGKMTHRLAVMVDTFFESLQVTAQGLKYRDPGYILSWAKADAGSNGGKRTAGEPWFSPAQ
ncbi:MAG: homogentisate 1,2-dioxygenase [Elusimicrobia bacterium]|nr:homogentisate 1,2-dioxygenase [Elusimicrobiota bacterium]